MRLLSATMLCLATLFSNAQAPQAFSYQAVARNNVGDPLANQAIGIRFQLRQFTAAGTVVFAETHSISTNALGLFNLPVGNGTPTLGTLAGVNWSSGPYFLEVAMDPAGGTSYAVIGAQQLLSVPYALFAGSAPSGSDDDWVVVADTVHSDGKWVGIGTASPKFPLHVAGGDVMIDLVRVGQGNSGVGQPQVYGNTAVGAGVMNVNSTGYENTGIGSLSLSSLTNGAHNVAVGSRTLVTGTSFTGNTAVGSNALFKNTSGGNTAIGCFALLNTTTGSNNTGVGMQALNTNTTGGMNTAIGVGAMYWNTTGSANTSMGTNSLGGNTTGSNNSGLGFDQLRNNTMGYDNAALGHSAMKANTTGHSNTAMGRSALQANTLGIRNVACGSQALNTTCLLYTSPSPRD